MKKVVFISGVSSGFGFEISKQLAEKGHLVYGTIRRACIVPEGVNPLIMDLTQRETIRQAIQHVISKEGRIDVLINNAGMHSGGPIEEVPELLLREHLETNLTGYIQVLQNVLPHMRKMRKGCVINISSIGGLTGLPFQGIHSATKFAMEGLSQALRIELKPFNIKVIVINPGDFRTNNTTSRIKFAKPNGGYEAQFNHTMSIIENDEAHGMNPVIMARRVSKIVDSDFTRNRYIVASFIQGLAVILKRILPEWLFSKIIETHYETNKFSK